MRIIELSELQEAVNWSTAIAAVKQSLTMMANKQVEAPKELAFKLNNHGEIHIKGAHLKEQPWIVFKLASGSFPKGDNSGCSILLGAESGEPNVLLNDSGWLTEMRTAAAGAVATDVLANDGPLRVAILGTGTQACYQLAALRSIRELSSVYVWGRTKINLQNFSEETSTEPCDTIDTAVKHADVIITTTSATQPILKGHHMQPGMHITAMGTDMTGKRELDAEVLNKADVIAADDLNTCVHVGELQYGATHTTRAHELASLFVTKSNGELPRKSRDDITIADMCGTGAFDAAIAAAAVEALGI